MARVVKVNLLLEAARYIRGARDAEKATDDLADGLDDAARTSDKTTKSAEKLGSGLDHLARDAKHLDAEIVKTKRGIRDLAREIATTSDEAKRADLTKKLGFEQRGLRKQVKLRDLIDFDDDAENVARGFSVSFVKRLGPLMATAPGAGAAGAAIGIAMAPAMAAAAAGAVVGGAGIGGIVGGVMLAARDERVKAAGADLGQYILGDLEDRAAGFVPVMLGNIDKIGAAWGDLGPDLDRIFESSRLVDPLVNGMVSGAKKLIHGVADAVDQADPVVRAFGRGMDRIGESAGDVFSTLADDADEGASAIDDLTASVANFITVSGKIIHAGAAVKGWMNQVDGAIDKGRYWIEDNSALAKGLGNVGIKLDLTADGFAAGTKEAEAYRAATLGTATTADFATLKLAGMTDAEIASADASGTYRGKLDEVNNALGRTGPAAQTAIEGVRPLNELLDDWSNKSIDVEEANIRLEEAIDNASEAAKRNGAGIDANKPKQRDNRQALIDIATAAKDAAKKIYDQTHSQEAASVATERGRKKFLEAAAAMHVGKDAAIALANKLFGIPKDTKPKVTVQDAQAKAALAAIKNGIATIHNKSVTVTVKYETRGRVQGEHTIGVGTNTKNRWGGVYEHAQVGLLREAQIASPMGPARYAWAEPETGGEAFIPRKGDLARSRSIWSHVGENWLGMRPALQPAGGGATVVRNLHVTVNVPATVNRAEVGREVVEAVKAYEQSSGKGWRS